MGEKLKMEPIAIAVLIVVLFPLWIIWLGFPIIVWMKLNDLIKAVEEGRN